MGAYFTDDLAVGVSDGANAVATAATRARHRKTEREIMVTVYYLFELCFVLCFVVVSSSADVGFAHEFRGTNRSVTIISLRINYFLFII